MDEDRLREDLEGTDPVPEREAVPDAESKGMSPKMRQLILSFDAKSPLKRSRARDARGRFVSSRADGR